MLIHRIVCVGVNHRTAPVEYREKLGGNLPALCERVRPRAHTASNGDGELIHEIAPLSTCNRVELYALLGERAETALLVSMLADAGGLDPRDVAGHTYEYSGCESVRHLCRVASGIDSLVLGEPQILGQVADALKDARSGHTVGPVLTRVFRCAVRTGRRARSETSIASSPASMSSVAVAVARNVVGSLRDRRVLVLGLGEMGSITLKALRARQVQEIAVANRTRARAEEVSARWGCRTYAMDELEAALDWADVVISATGCPYVIVDASVVQKVVARRGGRSLVFVDIAVPRDIDPAVRELPGVHLFDADDLGGNLDEGLAARRNEIPSVERIVAEELASFETGLRELEVEPLIEQMRRRAEAIRRQELESALEVMGDVDPATREALQNLSRSIVNRLLREPTVRLKRTVQEDHWDEYATAIRSLFGV
ncbi:MAG: glutamyl-tRNA reductase [Acidobacteriota bacterium]